MGINQGRRLKLNVLGSGTSHGIPVIGCFCPVCRSEDRHDKRYRSSFYIEGSGGERILVDTGPEFRLQAIRAGISCLDAVFITHSHADHLHGLDDLRPLSAHKAVPVFANKYAIKEIKERFPYIFKHTAQKGGGKPRIDLHCIGEKKNPPVVIGNITVVPLPVKHGMLDILGWKFIEGEKSAVYITDASLVPESTFKKAQDCTVLVLGSLRIEPHPTHFSFTQALAFAKKIYTDDMTATKLKSVYLTHICHNHSHKDIKQFCFDWKTKNAMADIEILPASDTMEIEV